MRINRTFLVLELAAACLVFFPACSTPTGGSSRRSLELTSERLARGGTVSVITSAKSQKTYPSESEALQTRLAEEFFRTKGFRISELPPGADYGFLIVSTVKNFGASSATVVGDNVYLNRKFTHTVAGEFHSLLPNGSPKQLLWTGYSLTVVPNGDQNAMQDLLVRELLKKFPQ